MTLSFWSKRGYLTLSVHIYICSYKPPHGSFFLCNVSWGGEESSSAGNHTCSCWPGWASWALYSAELCGHSACPPPWLKFPPRQVGGIKPGCFKIGNTGGMLDNILASKLYRPGSVAYVSRSGGMSNELNNIISRTTDGVYEGVAIGGDRWSFLTFYFVLGYSQWWLKW